MKYLAIVVLLTVVSGAALADKYVRPHTRSDGTYVEGHYRSSPNSTTLDNYSTKGNTNPYTGKEGTIDPYRQPTYNSPAPAYPNTHSNPYESNSSQHKSGW